MLDYISIENGVARIDLSMLSPDQAAAIYEIKTEHMESGQRTKIKLADKLRALTKLGEHLGIFSQMVNHGGAINLAILNEEAGL
jgi:phage terminase small subunit